MCRRGAARNGSLALIKALRLAGSLHHNLKMDCFAPMWVTIFCDSEVRKGTAAAAPEQTAGKYYSQLGNREMCRNSLPPI